MTSLNYPHDYPNNLERTETVQVAKGKLLRLEITHFEVQYGGNPPCKDNVKITDGDGTTLMDEICGYSNRIFNPAYFVPPVITTRSNTMEILFHTDDSYTREGWSLSWSAVTPGGEDFMFNSIGIFNPLNTESVRNRKNNKVPRPFDKKGSYIKSIFSGQNQRDKKNKKKQTGNLIL